MPVSPPSYTDPSQYSGGSTDTCPIWDTKKTWPGCIASGGVRKHQEVLEQRDLDMHPRAAYTLMVSISALQEQRRPFTLRAVSSVAQSIIPSSWIHTLVLYLSGTRDSRDTEEWIVALRAVWDAHNVTKYNRLMVITEPEPQCQLVGWKSACERLRSTWMPDDIVMLCDDDDLVTPTRVAKQSAAQVREDADVVTAVYIHRETCTSPRLAAKLLEGMKSDIRILAEPTLNKFIRHVIVRGTDTACLAFRVVAFVAAIARLPKVVTRFGDIALWIYIRQRFTTVLLAGTSQYIVLARPRGAKTVKLKVMI